MAENIVLKNYMETCVLDTVINIRDELDCCTCQTCLYDVTAIALNMLPAKYVVTKKGQFYTKLDTLENQYHVDIIAAITKAAVIVGKYPRHDTADRLDENE